VQQLMDYLTSANRLPQLQSGFSPGHSTQTAVIKVISDIIQAISRSITLPTFQVAKDLALTAATVSSSLRFTAPLSIFGCWPVGVKLFATGDYGGTVSGDLQHWTRDVSVD